jgi:hypothetical protein
VAASTVKKTILLPAALAREAERTAKTEGKTLSGVIQDALRVSRAERLKHEFHTVQDYWSKRAQEKGVLTEQDLERYLRG